MEKEIVVGPERRKDAGTESQEHLDAKTKKQYGMEIGMLTLAVRSSAGLLVNTVDSGDSYSFPKVNQGLLATLSPLPRCEI